MKHLFSVVIFAFLFSFKIFAQAGVGLTSLPPNEAKEYAKPLTTFLGTFFNSGTYYSADIPEDFNFKFAIVGAFIFIPESQQTFTANPELNGYNSLGETATFTGDKGGVFLGPQGFVTYPHGFDIGSLPAGIYQIAGSYYGTELLVRFFPTISVGDVEAGLWGLGLRVNLSQFVQDTPLDFAVQLLYNSFGFEYKGNNPKNYVKMDSKNFAVNAHASKAFEEMFIVYGGLQYESSTMDINYYFKDPNKLYPQIRDQVLSTSVDGSNNFRFTAGGAIELPVVVFNLDFNISSMFAIGGGITLRF
jgi:hypothetical protein